MQQQANIASTRAVREEGVDAAACAGKYLAFRLGDEEFGIGLLKVREIIGRLTITSVPGTPPHIRGVINLRGKVIPVMELRRRFGLPAIEDDERHCIIVVEVMIDDEQTVEMGVLVDSVSEVLNINAVEIEPPPDFGNSVETSYILGMAKSGETVKILLNIERVVLRDRSDLETAQNFVNAES